MLYKESNFKQQKGEKKMSNDKYTMFKNFMHNELAISKDDIKKWTQDAIKQVAEDYVHHQMNEETLIAKIIREAIHKPIYGGFVDDIKKEVSRYLSNKILLSLKNN